LTVRKQLLLFPFNCSVYLLISTHLNPPPLLPPTLVADLTTNREVSLEEGQMFAAAQKLRFFEVSAVTKWNIPQVFDDALYDFPLDRPKEGEDDHHYHKGGHGGGHGEGGDSSASAAGDPSLDAEEGPAVFVEYLLGETQEPVLETVWISLPPFSVKLRCLPC